MQDPIKILKTKSLPEFLITYLKIPLISTGKNYSTCCPFHEEKTPSFSVSPQSNRWKCFGSCGINGDIIEFVQRYKQFEFQEALEFLCNIYGLEFKKSSSTSPKDSSKLKILEINSFVSDFYRNQLDHLGGSLGLDYLEKRNQNFTICEQFSLGYAPHHSEYGWQLLYNELVKKEFPLDLCEKIGLIKKTKKENYIDCFHGRIIFPIFNLQNECIGFNSRILPQFETYNTNITNNGDTTIIKVPKYLLSKETEVFNRKKILYGYNKTKKAIDKINIVCVVEGIFDFLRMYSFGIENCIPLLGGEFFGPDVLNYYLLMDNDAAGVSYTNKIGTQLLQQNKHVRICSLKKDPDDCTKQETYDSIRNSPTYIDWVINRSFKYKDSIEHKLNILQQIRNILNGVPPINIILYCNDIANKLTLPIDLVIPYLTFGEIKYKKIIEELRQS